MAWLGPATVLPCTASSTEGSDCSASTCSASSASIGGVSPGLPSMAMSFAMSHMSHKHTDFTGQIGSIKTAQ